MGYCNDWTVQRADARVVESGAPWLHAEVTSRQVHFTTHAIAGQAVQVRQAVQVKQAVQVRQAVQLTS
jgi:hypothetical protein